MGLLSHLSPKVFDLLFLEDPIHIPSILAQLIFRPEISLNDFNRLRNAELIQLCYCLRIVSIVVV